MKTTVLTSASIDEQMSTDASGEKKMQVGRGANAADAPEDAVTPANATNANANAAPATPAARLLQDAQVTKTNGTNTTKDQSWKKLKKEEDLMRVVLNKKMFEKGGPLANISNPIIMFNQQPPDYVAEFPRARKGTYHANGTKINKTKAELEAEEKLKKERKAKNGTAAVEIDQDDYMLEDTRANQVLELEFIDADTMEPIPIKNLKKGMLQVCMMKTNQTQRMMYVNE